MKVKVAVVDDGSVAIRGAAGALRDSDHYAFMGVFDTVERVTVPPAEPAVLVADPFAGTDSSLNALTMLPGHVAALVMSAATQPETVRQALQAGVRGFVGKEVDVSSLLAAVNVVGAGGIYLGGSLNNLLMRCLDHQETVAPATPEALTPRERDVLVMIARGLTHKQIGNRLGLSKATVDTYVHRVRQKVGSVNKAGLTRFAMDLNLL
jgi:two-component system, NarL family, nitrate/nitrite response regulator NarL